MTRTHILGSSLASLSLDRVRPSHVEGWVVDLRREGLAESTIRSAYTILRGVLDTAVRDGALASDPAAVIRRPKVSAKEAPHLTPAQVAELLRAAEGSRYAPLFTLLVHTGFRLGEALALQWPDVDLAKGILRVRGTLSRIDGELTVTEPKTARSKRFEPISEPAERLLRRVHAAQAEERRLAGAAWRQPEFVFTTEFGEPGDPRNAFRALRAAAMKAGLPHAGLHTLRHAAASVMITRGVPLRSSRTSSATRRSRAPATSTVTSPPTSPAKGWAPSATPWTGSPSRHHTERPSLSVTVGPVTGSHPGIDPALAAASRGELRVGQWWSNRPIKRSEAVPDLFGHGL